MAIPVGASTLSVTFCLRQCGGQFFISPDTGSYVEHQENRKRLIEAHHPDAVTSGGARHAGNLLILSHLEHHRYGQRISRGEIIAALKRGGTRRVLRFGSGKSVTRLQGSVIEVEITATGEKVPIFFTDDHRDYWLSQAK